MLAAGKIIFSLAKSPFLLRERIFWSKFELFLSGIDIDEDDRANFCKKLTEDGTKRENQYRLLQAIDYAETQRKIIYLINASRSLSANFIELPTYFRMCNAITNALPEDLEFLANHILDSADFSYDDTIQGLMNVGLMYQSTIGYNSLIKYKFTPFAKDLDKFAISFDDDGRYPMINGAPQSHEREIRQKVEQLEWGTF